MVKGKRLAVKKLNCAFISAVGLSPSAYNVAAMIESYVQDS